MTNVPLLFLLLIFAGMPQEAHANPVVLQGGMVWSGNGDPAQAADVLIVDERIEAIGPNLPVPPQARVIDVVDQWVMPGLIDSHVHVTSVPGNAYRGETEDIILDKIGHQLRSYLACGVTTVLDNGIELEHAEKITQALTAGQLIGPRLEFLGPILGPHGGYPHVIVPTLSTFDDESSLVAALDGVKSLGGVGIKVPLEEGFVGRGWKIHDPQSREMISSLAKARDLPIFVHAISPREYDIGLDMGASVFVHPLDRYNRRVARRLSQNSARVISTISIYDNFRYVHRPELLDSEAMKLVVHPDLLSTAKDPGARRTYQRAILDLAPTLTPTMEALVLYGLDGERPSASRVKGTQRRIKRLHQQGVQIVLGSDAGNWYILPFAFHGIETRYEFELLAEAIGAENALRSATIHGAELLGLSEEIGTLEIGKRADIVVIDGRPLERPKDLWNVTWTVRNGQAQTPSEWMKNN